MEKREKNEIAVFGGGCFWCTEAVFKMLKGVRAVASGYAGGTKSNPTYKEVCTGNTGHAEVIEIEYDPLEISYRDLLTVFFATHDPTTPNRQGNDAGPQYRSIILYASGEQKRAAEEFIAEINASHPDGKPPAFANASADATASADKSAGKVVTEVKPLERFYPAEDYHRDYFAKNPQQAYCQLAINPKLEQVQQKFAELLKPNSNGK